MALPASLGTITAGLMIVLASVTELTISLRTFPVRSEPSQSISGSVRVLTASHWNLPIRLGAILISIRTLPTSLSIFLASLSTILAHFPTNES